MCFECRRSSSAGHIRHTLMLYKHCMYRWQNVSDLSVLLSPFTTIDETNNSTNIFSLEETQSLLYPAIGQVQSVTCPVSLEVVSPSACATCLPGFYKLDVSNTKCRRCPTHAKCTEGNVNVDRGFFGVVQNHSVSTV